MHFDFELYKDILEDEVKEFNSIYSSISKEIKFNAKIIEEYHGALRHRIDIYVENKRLLRIHMFKKYNIGFVDINELIMKYNNRTKYIEHHPEIFQDKYILEKLESISNFNKKSEEIDKLKVKNSEMKIILSKVHHLTAEHFVYSSLEALKNTVLPEVIYSSIESYSNRVPHSLYINDVCSFPHNTETNVKFIDENLVLLFEDIFKYELISTSYGERYYTLVHKIF